MLLYRIPILKTCIMFKPLFAHYVIKHIFVLQNTDRYADS